MCMHDLDGLETVVGHNIYRGAINLAEEAKQKPGDINAQLLITSRLNAYIEVNPNFREKITDLFFHHSTCSAS